MKQTQKSRAATRLNRLSRAAGIVIEYAPLVAIPLLLALTTYLLAGGAL